MQRKLKVQVWVYRRTDGANGGVEVLLLLLRPERGGFWQPVTGGVEAGEATEAAALREATEETGLVFAGGPVSLDYRFTFSARGHEFEEHVYALRAKGREVKLDAREHVDSRWLAIGEAETELKHESNAEGLRRLKATMKEEFS